MKVLFVQNLPHKLRTALASLGSRHEIVTAAYLGWGELKNGELLRTAEANGMEVFVTGDGSLSFEQDLAGRRLAIVALSTNNWPIIKNHVPRILAAIKCCEPRIFPDGGLRKAHQKAPGRESAGIENGSFLCVLGKRGQERWPETGRPGRGELCLEKIRLSG